MTQLLLVVHGDALWTGVPPVTDRFEHEVIQAAGGWVRNGGAGVALAGWQERVRDLVSNAGRWSNVTVLHLAAPGAVPRTRAMANASALPGFSPAYCALNEGWAADTVASGIAYAAGEMDVTNRGFDTLLVVARENDKFAEELRNRLAVQMDAWAAVVTVDPTLGLIERDIVEVVRLTAPRGIDGARVEVERSADEPI